MHLRETFNTVAELYDRARPGYPGDLYDELARLVPPGPAVRVLEIAPGTGKATVALAERGYAVTAVEMGPELARVARRNLAGYAHVSVQVARFEDWPLPAEPFHLACCATGFSWLDPGTRLDRCAAALRPGGYLAIWDALHVDGGTSQFFVDVQECYERWDPATPPGLRLEAPGAIAPNDYGLAAHGSFDPPIFRDYLYEIPYSAAAYLDVLGTYSGHIALPDGDREGLLGCIRELIEGRYGGSIVKAYAARLLVARRR